MKKSILILLLSLLCFSCQNDDDNQLDCGLYAPAFPSVFLKITDDNGNNLLENGTINPDDIILQSGLGFRYNPASKSTNANDDIKVLDNTLELYIPNDTAFDYIFQLNDAQTVELHFATEALAAACGLVYFVPTSVVYNNQDQTLDEVFPQVFLTSISL